jgi:cytochrome c553
MLTVVMAARSDSMTMNSRTERRETIDEKTKLCASCHGTNGIQQQKTTPVIWGQQLGYLYLQLRDYKGGTRKNEQMSAVAAGLERDDMMALAQYFSQKQCPTFNSRVRPKR